MALWILCLTMYGLSSSKGISYYIATHMLVVAAHMEVLNPPPHTPGFFTRNNMISDVSCADDVSYVLMKLC